MTDHIHHAVEVRVDTCDPGDFSKAVEVLSRALAGLALEGIDGSMETMELLMHSHVGGEEEDEPTEAQP